MTEDNIKSALKGVKYPGYSRDIVSFGLVKEISIADGVVSVALQLNSDKSDAAAQLKSACEAALRPLAGVKDVRIDIRMPAGSAAVAGSSDPWGARQPLPGIRHVVAIASGKGGVGKSTVSVNLACALTQLGARVGLLDCDIYGPSIPLMMGINQRPTLSAAEKLEPPVNHGVKLMSIGFLLDGDTPVIWRGPMIVKTIQQFIGAVEWGQLDFLLIDLPPGTGDAQLTMCQTVPLSGGVVVTTPQEASLGVVRKGLAMFTKLNVPILGIVENMSYFTTPTGERVEIFGYGGGRQEAARQNVDFLGEIPLFVEIRAGGDKGVPIVVSSPKTPPAAAFIEIAETLRRKMA
jgi:ATP-binding protein involved in chromosome partitioning